MNAEQLKNSILQRAVFPYLPKIYQRASTILPYRSFYRRWQDKRFRVKFG